MQLHDDLLEHLRELEESLWIAETRFDRVHMARILTPDFFEFGCSGRIYQREETLDSPPRVFRATLPLRDFAVRRIAAEVIQVTYISEVVYGDAYDDAYVDVQICNRSSIWVKTEAGWQLYFHQGTPAET